MLNRPSRIQAPRGALLATALSWVTITETESRSSGP
jgi:hypothetical protein